MGESTSRMLELLIIVLLVLLSKTVYFGIIHKQTIWVLLILCIAIFIFLKGKIKITLKTLKTLMSLIFLILLGWITHLSDITKEYILTDMSFIFLLIEVAIVISIINKSKFIKNYVNSMVVISAISLIYFIIGLKYSGLISSLSESFFIGNKRFIVSPFYTWGFDSFIYSRNAGPFWEPGAFQGFILIAIIMLLSHKESINRIKTKFLILSVTLFTTQSTTGYILFAIICLVFSNDLIKIFSLKNKKIGKIFNHIIIFPVLIITTILVLFFIFKSEVIINKLSNQNISFNMRFKDFFNSLIMVAERPIFGYGNGTAKVLREATLGIHDNSVGLLSLFYRYGGIFFSFYIYKYKVGLDSLFPNENRVKKAVVYIIFITMYLTQGLYYLPLFSIFLFEWPEQLNSKRKNGWYAK